jgi:hypothetical protein
MITLDDFTVTGTKQATRGANPNWDAAHKWIQCFADWTEHTKVFNVAALDPSDNSEMIEWGILADCEYQAIQTAYILWDNLPERDKATLLGEDLLDD